MWCVNWKKARMLLLGSWLYLCYHININHLSLYTVQLLYYYSFLQIQEASLVCFFLLLLFWFKCSGSFLFHLLLVEYPNYSFERCYSPQKLKLDRLKYFLRTTGFTKNNTEVLKCLWMVPSVCRAGLIDFYVWVRIADPDYSISAKLLFVFHL